MRRAVLPEPRASTRMSSGSDLARHAGRARPAPRRPTTSASVCGVSCDGLPGGDEHDRRGGPSKTLVREPIAPELQLPCRDGGMALEHEDEALLVVARSG